MSAIAVIPARGGSKGIPRKNLLPLCGKPLVCHTIEAALRAKLVDRVVVSTDDIEIADIANETGAEVIMRPPDLSTDTASSEDALVHALENLRGRLPELVVFLQCTSPLTRGEDIDRCIQRLLGAGADSAFTASASHRFLWKNPDAAEGVNHSGTERKRRQDLDPEYAENGAVYAMRTEGFLSARHRFFGRTVISEMPAARSWEIDGMGDVRVAEALARDAGGAGEAVLPERLGAVVFDFDGVMTDNTVYVSQDGKESVRCHRGDGWIVRRMQEAGIRMAVMSTEENPVVEARCAKLKLPCFQQLGDTKLDRLTSWCDEHGIDLASVIYVGNDENDVACLRAVGAGVAPADAHRSAKDAADLVLEGRGGEGAVREICDTILERYGS